MKRIAGLTLAAGALVLLVSACQPDDDAGQDNLRHAGGQSASPSATASRTTATTTQTSKAATTTGAKVYTGDAAMTCKQYLAIQSSDDRKKVVGGVLNKPAQETTVQTALVTFSCKLPNSADQPIGKFLED